MIEQVAKKELILPGTQEFDETLAQFPPNWQDVAWRSCGEFAHIVRPHSGGLLETVPIEVAEEYYFSGEYDERLNQIDFPSDELETELFYDPINDEYYGFE